MTPVLSSKSPITLIGGGSVTKDDIAAARTIAPLVVAADSGADSALFHGIRPAAVIGDFDSVSAQARHKIAGENLHQVAEQDSTDFEKCLQRLVAPLIIAIGFSGSRHDHFLAVLNTLARQIGPKTILLGGEDVIALLPAQIALDLPAGTRVSLFPMGAARGTSTGLHWPIDGVEFDSDKRIGTSNRALGPVQITMSGPCLLILPRNQLNMLAAAL